MTTLRQTPTDRVRLLALAVGLALVAALAYLLIAQNVLAVGDLRLAEEGGNIIYVAAACYFVGGLLIFARQRWLWLLGAVINALIILFFFNLYQNRPAVLLSPGAIITKAAQLLLEVLLLYLIISDWLRSRRQSG